ncbi:MAG: 2-oxoglutarate dehydrogenase complex dihydrolipoyllysine-residue succinyltransferase [Chloroflexota bacterium]|nr:2-oxoglutarate dehydrogenase complex dihydrolipoyllysine-residue succinyltransferase [Chloroflexota bacterium]
MPAEIRVPELGESIVEVIVQRWLKQEGETVAEGDALVELETEKANVEIPADRAGVLASIARQEGEIVQVGELLGTIGDGSSGAATAPTASDAGQGNGSVEQTDADDAPLASPAVRRLAVEHGIDLAEVKGTGPRSRVTREDVLAYIGRPTEAAAASPTPAPPARHEPSSPVSVDSDRRERREPMTLRRRTIARRLVEAQQTAAMLTTFNEADMSAVMEVRKRRNEAFQQRHGIKLGFMSFFVKAVIGALREFPYLNAEIDGDEIVLKEYYDIGIAVGVPEGLVVPVVRDADRKSFAQIEREIADLAAKARENRLGLADLQGGTFTITNGGVYGSLMSTPILNAPQVGILGMHAIKQRPVVVGEEVVVRPMMYLALSYDHRIVDGSDAVRFLVRVKEMVEEPETLLLEG